MTDNIEPNYVEILMNLCNDAAAILGVSGATVHKVVRDIGVHRKTEFYACKSDMDVYQTILGITVKETHNWYRFGDQSKALLKEVQRQVRLIITEKTGLVNNGDNAGSIPSTSGQTQTQIKYFKHGSWDYQYPMLSSEGYHPTRTEIAINRYAQERRLEIQSCAVDGDRGIWVIFKERS